MKCPMKRFKTILFPTDFSRRSAFPLEYVKDIARRNKSKIIVLHVIESLEEMPHVPLPERTIKNLEQERLGLAREKLKEYTQRFLGTFKKVSTEVAEGIPYQVIVDIAKERKADLIIMGTHSREGLVGIFIGHNAKKVIKTAPCPVLTVRGTRGKR